MEIASSNLATWTVVVAQLVRARDCGSRGRGFESHRPPNQPLTAGEAMKTVKLLHGPDEGVIQRLPDTEAMEKVDAGVAVYIPKKEWKEKVRNPQLDKEKANAQTKANKANTRANRRHRRRSHSSDIPSTK